MTKNEFFFSEFKFCFQLQQAQNSKNNNLIAAAMRKLNSLNFQLGQIQSKVNACKSRVATATKNKQQAQQNVENCKKQLTQHTQLLGNNFLAQMFIFSSLFSHNSQL
jgi:chromosome segregation ATPase